MRSVVPAAATAPSLPLGLAAMNLCFSSVVPYSLELLALRRLDPRVFGVLLSLEPALAALAGLVFLGERLSPSQIAGIGLVVVASALVMRDQPADPAMEAAEIG